MWRLRLEDFPDNKWRFPARIFLNFPLLVTRIRFWTDLLVLSFGIDLLPVYHLGMMIIVIILPSMYGAFSTSPSAAMSFDKRSNTLRPVEI